MVQYHELANKVFLLGDIHMGVRTNSSTWMKIQEDFLFTEFPRLAAENGHHPNTDILILEGDIFHNRQSIDVTVVKMAVKVFRKLCSIFKKVYVIVGNHDVYYKDSNEVTSLHMLRDMLDLYEDITGKFVVLTEPAHLTINGKHKYLMLPWEHNNEKLVKTITDNASVCDYIICHADIQGARFNKFVKVEHGIDTKALSKYKKVYAGHIHIRQEFTRAGSSVSYTGTPYQMDRGDIGNQKGFDIFTYADDTVTEQFVPNHFSPKFVKWNVYKLLNLSISDIRSAFSNNFVDISVDSKIADRFSPTAFLELIGETGARSIEFTNYTSETTIRVKDLAQNISDDELSMDGIFDLYCNQKTYDTLLRKKITDKFRGYLTTVRDNAKTVL